MDAKTEHFYNDLIRCKPDERLDTISHLMEIQRNPDCGLILSYSLPLEHYHNALHLALNHLMDQEQENFKLSLGTKTFNPYKA